MMNISSFAFVDTAMMAATLTLKYATRFDTDPRPREVVRPHFYRTKCLVLRGPKGNTASAWLSDEPQADWPMFKEWPASHDVMSAVIMRIGERLGAPNLQLGRVAVESLEGGSFVGWHVDDTPYGKAHARFRLMLMPCAGYQLYCGGEMIEPGVGNLTYYNTLALSSMVNLGPVPRVDLVVDVRRPVLQ